MQEENVSKREPRLAALGDLSNFKVANGNPDIRGWEVFGSDSLRVGEVRELIVDTEAMKARYMVLILDRSVPNVGANREVLVAIGRARLDDALDRVYLDDVTVATAASLPAYGPAPFDVEREKALFGGGTERYTGPEYDTGRFFGARSAAPGEAYVMLHEEELAVGTREVKAGEVVVHKHVETEHVRREVPVTREEVTIERRAVAPGEDVPGEVTVSEGEVRIPVMAEEAVVDKRIVATEEVIVRKTPVHETAVVEADLKRERVDIEAPETVKKKEEV